MYNYFHVIALLSIFVIEQRVLDFSYHGPEFTISFNLRRVLYCSIELKVSSSR